jgi:hypothetical protein
METMRNYEAIKSSAEVARLTQAVREASGVKGRQEGAVLLVSVVTLSLLALAGIGTVEQTLVADRAAATGRAGQQALQEASEGVSQAIEDLLSGDIFTFGGCGNSDEVNWSCTVESDDGFTYTVSYIKSGDDIASDAAGNRLYHIKSDGSFGTEANTQVQKTISAGIALGGAEAKGVWSDALVACSYLDVKAHSNQNGVAINGDVRTLEEGATVKLKDYVTIDGDLNYTDSDPDIDSEVIIRGSSTLVMPSECDPLDINQMFTVIRNTKLGGNEPNNKLDKDEDMAFGSGDSDGDGSTLNDFYSFKEFKLKDHAITVEGNVTIYVGEKFEIKNSTIELLEDATLTLYLGGTKGNKDIKIENSGLLGVGTDASPETRVFMYAEDQGDDDDDDQGKDNDDEKNKTEIIISQNGPKTVCYEIKNGVTTDKEKDCDDNDNKVAAVNVPARPWGGLIYAPQSDVYMKNAFLTGSVWSDRITISDDDDDDASKQKNKATQINYASASGDDSEGESEKSYSVLYYTEGDVRFAAGQAVDGDAEEPDLSPSIDVVIDGGETHQGENLRICIRNNDAQGNIELVSSTLTSMPSMVTLDEVKKGNDKTINAGEAHEVRFKLDYSGGGNGTIVYDGPYTALFTFSDGSEVEYSVTSVQGGNVGC